jgi:predicted dehydrogenase
MSSPVKVAIVGAGIGAEHLQAYLQLPHLYDVRVVCDLDESRAQGIAATHGIAVSANMQQVLEDNAIDLVDICLPPHAHLQASIAAIKHGKHVICEKPLVSSVAEADQLIAVLNESPKKLFPVFQYRYGPATAQLQALIDVGLAGKAYTASIETHWCRGADYYQVPWRGTFAGEQGGAVLCHAIHNHDLLCRFFGPVKRVSAMVTTRVNPIETEDCAAISFEMCDGSLASSSITLGAANDTTRLRFCFEKLTAQSGETPYAPATDRWTFVAKDPQAQPMVDEVAESVKVEHSGYAGYFEAIAAAIAGQDTHAVSVDDGRRSIELVAAIYAAASAGRTVDLPLDSNSPYYSSLHPQTNEG